MYLDDIIIFSKNNEQHLKNIEEVLSTLYATGMSLKLKKCLWFTTKVKYLWQTITPHKLSIMEAHIKVFKDM